MVLVQRHYLYVKILILLCAYTFVTMYPHVK
jgi:hypothetical protein